MELHFYFWLGCIFTIAVVKKTAGESESGICAHDPSNDKSVVCYKNDKSKEVVLPNDIREDIEIIQLFRNYSKAPWLITNAKYFQRFPELTRIIIHGPIKFTANYKAEKDDFISRLFNLPNLRFLECHNCQLDSSRHMWELPSSLEVLVLKNNLYKRYKLQNCPNLTYVDFEGNSLEEMPQWHFPPPPLEQLNLLRNPRLVVTVEDIGIFCKLQKVSFDINDVLYKRTGAYCECKKIRDWVDELNIKYEDSNGNMKKCLEYTTECLNSSLDTARQEREACLTANLSAAAILNSILQTSLKPSSISETPESSSMWLSILLVATFLLFLMIVVTIITLSLRARGTPRRERDDDMRRPEPKRGYSRTPSTTSRYDERRRAVTESPIKSNPTMTAEDNKGETLSDEEKSEINLMDKDPIHETEAHDERSNINLTDKDVGGEVDVHEEKTNINQADKYPHNETEFHEQKSNVDHSNTGYQSETESHEGIRDVLQSEEHDKVDVGTEVQRGDLQTEELHRMQIESEEQKFHPVPDDEHYRAHETSEDQRFHAMQDEDHNRMTIENEMERSNVMQGAEHHKMPENEDASA